MKHFRIVIAVTLTGCGVVQTPDDPLDAAAAVDGAVGDAVEASCDDSTAFGPPVAVDGLRAQQGVMRLSRDELTAVFQDWNDGYELYTAQRDAIDAPFGVQGKLAGVNSPAQDSDAALSGDGLRLVFASARNGGAVTRIWMAARPLATTAFGAPAEVLEISTTTAGAHDGHPYLRDDGGELWFTSSRPGGLGGQDLYRATASGAGFDAPQRVAELASSEQEWLPVISADGRTVYFASTRLGGGGSGLDIWTAHRPSPSDDFDAPVPMRDLNTAGSDIPTWISPDNCRLYLDTAEGIEMVTRSPR